MNAMIEICLYCKHRNKDCEFGENIPDLILIGRFNHKTPIGKEKILFEFDDDISDKKKEYINFDFVDKKEAKKILKNLKGKII
jgi:hypothetical protein